MATPENLIMAGCELDSLTDGPGARAARCIGQCDGRKEGGGGEGGGGGGGGCCVSTAAADSIDQLG